MAPHTRFRLRIDGQDQILTVGDHVMGRSPDCDIALDDPMASRQHAVLHVSPEGVVLEDLGSRNGVLVNGVKMFEPVTLHHGDKVLVGSSEVFLVEAARRRREEMATRPLSTSGTRAAYDSNAPQWDSDTTNTGSVYEVLVAACDRALLQGDLRDAEAAVRNLLLSVRAAMLRRQLPDDHTMRSVAGFALQMAERTTDPTWLDRLFEVMATGRQVPDTVTVERLLRMVPRLGLGGSEAVRGYLARMADKSDELGADEVRRLDTLAEAIGQVGT